PLRLCCPTVGGRVARSSTMASRTCFVICPLGDPASSSRASSDGLLKHIIRPVLEYLDYSVDRADWALDHPEIPTTISKRVLQADLVIADLTDLNSNVLYELGKRHALNRACILFTWGEMAKLLF